MAIKFSNIPTTIFKWLIIISSFFTYCQPQFLDYNCTNISPKSACRRDCPKCPPPPGRAEVEPHSWPWMVALTRKKYPRRAYCGGFLLTKHYVVTAAHCVYYRSAFRSPDDFFVLLGSHDTSSSGQLMKIQSIAVHPDYNRRSLYRDIAIIRLEKAVEFSAEVQPACVVEHGDVALEGKTLTLLGWGNSDPSTTTATVVKKLQSVQVPVVNHKFCNESYVKLRDPQLEQGITDGIFCGGDLNSSEGPSTSGSCHGEGGGPIMMLDSDCLWKVVGLVSFGRGDCSWKEFQAPDAYTKLSSYWNWIKDVIANDGDSQIDPRLTKNK